MRRLLFLFCLSPLVAACGSASEGVEGNSSFQFSSNLFGTAVDKPIMVGAVEPMSVSSTDLASVRVSSSDPTVIALANVSLRCKTTDGKYEEGAVGVACPSGSKGVSIAFDARALRAGTATIRLVGANFETVDSLVVSTADAKAVSFVGCPDGTKTYVNCALDFQVRDANGRRLQASSGVHFSSSNFEVVGFSNFLVAPVADVDATRGFLRDTQMATRGVGTANVTATAPGGVATVKSVRVDP